MKGVILESKLVPKDAATPFVATIPTGQWSGSGSDRYITVQASNVTANSVLVPHYDSASDALLNGPLWCVPANGSFTIHTSAIPSGTVTVMVQLLGTLGEANYQVLADVYSTSQVDSIVAQSTAIKANRAFSNNGISSGSFTVPSNVCNVIFVAFGEVHNLYINRDSGTVESKLISKFDAQTARGLAFTYANNTVLFTATAMLWNGYAAFY